MKIIKLLLVLTLAFSFAAYALTLIFTCLAVLDGDITVTLQENDQVRIYSLGEVEGVKTVSISGYGVTAREVSITENLSLYDLIFQSVSYDELEFQSKILTSRLDLNRFDSNTGLYSTIQFDFDDTATEYYHPGNDVNNFHVAIKLAYLIPLAN